MGRVYDYYLGTGIRCESLTRRRTDTVSMEWGECGLMGLICFDSKRLLKIYVCLLTHD